MRKILTKEKYNLYFCLNFEFRQMAEEKKEGMEKVERKEIFSKAIRAGKRTYFLDVKATKKNEYYLTITESKKHVNFDGQVSYEKHKIFLYKEDMDKFVDNLQDVISFIKEKNKENSFNADDINFEDL